MLDRRSAGFAGSYAKHRLLFGRVISLTNLLIYLDIILIGKVQWTQYIHVQ